MPWTLPPLPPSATAALGRLPLPNDKVPTDIELPYWFYRAIREKTWVTGACYTNWPRQNNPMVLPDGAGIVTSITATSLTDENADFSITPKRCGLDLGWNQCWIVIYYQDDPRYIAKANIMGASSTDPTTIEFDDQSWIARGVVPDLADLVGCSYDIFAGGDICSYDRWMDWPNAWEYIRYFTGEVDLHDNKIYAPGSFVTNTGEDSSGGGWFIEDDTQGWSDNQFGKAQHSWPDNPTAFDVVLVTEDSTGTHVRRAAITRSTSNRVYFHTPSGWTPGIGDYFSVIKRGARWDPSQKANPRKQWITCATTGFLTHAKDDSIGTGSLPAVSLFKDTSRAPDCGTPEDVCDSDCMDTDLWNDCCDPECCSTGNENYTPNFYKSWRGLLSAVIGMCGSPWVAPFDGGTARPLSLTFPLAANLIGGTSPLFSAGSGTISVAPGSGKAYVDLTPPYMPFGDGPFWYTVFAADGSVLSDGKGLSHDTGGYYLSGSFGDEDDGLTVYWTFGLLRRFDYEFLRMYGPRTVWFPGIDPDTGGVIDPPINEFGKTGGWVTDGGPSTNLVVWDVAVGAPSESGPTIVDGDLVRFIGQNPRDPTLYPLEADQVWPLAPYKDKFFTGKLSPIPPNLAYKNRPSTGAPFKGAVTSIGTTGGVVTQLTFDINWFEYWYSTASGTAFTDEDVTFYIDTGEATGGGATTLVDSSKTSNFFWAVGFLDVGLTLELNHPTGDIHQLLITAVNHATGTITFLGKDGVTVSAGDSYRILMPKYELNRWKGHPGIITVPAVIDSSGTHAAATYSFMGDKNGINTLFIPASLGVTVSEGQLEAGVTVSIEGRAPGGVYRYSDHGTGGEIGGTEGGGRWTIPTGTDNRIDPKTGVKPTFRADVTANAPFQCQRYGLINSMDLFGTWIPNGIYELLLVLQATLGGVTCRNIPSIGATPENNVLVGIQPVIGGANWPQLGGTDVCSVWENSVIHASSFSGAFGYFVAQWNLSWAGNDLFDPTAGSCALQFVGYEDPSTPAPGYTTSAEDNFCPQAKLQVGAVSGEIIEGTEAQVNSDFGYVADGDSGSPPAGGSISRAYAYFEDSGIPTCLNCTVDFYAHAIIETGDPDDGVFLAFGDPYPPGPSILSPFNVEYRFDNQGTGLQFRKYTKVTGGSSSIGGSGIVFSGKVGNDDATPPTWIAPADPVGHGQEDASSTATPKTWLFPESSVTSGYLVDHVVSVRTWEFQYT